MLLRVVLVQLLGDWCQAQLGITLHLELGLEKMTEHFFVGLVIEESFQLWDRDEWIHLGLLHEVFDQIFNTEVLG